MYSRFFPQATKRNEEKLFRDRFIPPFMADFELARAHYHLTQQPTPADHNPDLVYQNTLSKALLGVSANDLTNLPIIPVIPTQRLAHKARLTQLKDHKDYVGLSTPPPIYTLNSSGYSGYQPVIDDFYCNPLDWSQQTIFSASRQRLFSYDMLTMRGDWVNRDSNDSCYITCLKSTADAAICVTAQTQPSKISIEAWDVQTTQSRSSIDAEALTLNLCSINNETYLGSSIYGGIYLFDQRASQAEFLANNQSSRKMPGLAYNGEYLLATGDDANEVLIWDMRNFQQPIMTFNGHQSCVRALEFSPHNHQLLASGGGKHDQTIKIWDACTGELTANTPADSSVTSIHWLDKDNVVTAHGFPEGGDVRTWSYQANEQYLVETFFMNLVGRKRVLGTAISPNKQSIAVLSSLDMQEVSGLFEQEWKTPMGSFEVLNIRREPSQPKKQDGNDLFTKFTIR